jgi:hypothetical protein
MDLEKDIIRSPEILDKVVTRNDYAQNLYAAMCNMRWVPADAITILKEDFWHCSWRSAGGIVARLQGKGDYMNWYCSGMGGFASFADETDEEAQAHMDEKGFVPEGIVTEEIRTDLRSLGWIPSPWPKDND